MLEDKQVGLTFPGDANEGLIVILDHPDHFFSAGHLDPHANAVLDQLLEVFRFLERMFRGARRFALLCRTRSPYCFFLVVRSGVTEMRDGPPEPLPSASP